MRLKGLRFDVVAKDDIYYILLYDIDYPQLNPIDLETIDSTMKLYGISYLLYKTKNGYHLIGLTPMDNYKWCVVFGTLKNYFHSYHGGVVIRLSRKKDEVQELVRMELDYGEVIPNLYNIFASRFNYNKRPWTRELAKYLLIFEVYRSEKE